MDMLGMLGLALNAARQGARVLLAHMDRPDDELVIRAKRDGTPVSAADMASHRAIEVALAPSGIPVISEEGELPPYAVRKLWPHYWLVDPLDGTASFLQQRSGFAVNIALCGPDGPIIGVVADPLEGVVYSGSPVFGGQTHSLHPAPSASGIPLRPLPPARPYRLLASSTERASLEDLLPPHLLPSAPDDFVVTRMSGAQKFCHIAAGRADLHSRTGPYMEWDCAAGDGLLRAQGLAVIDRHTGAPLRYNSPTLLVQGLWVSRV
jgi:3'(2'), 5'-bisphosphate nucleotidase